MNRKYFIAPCLAFLGLVFGIESARADLIINLAGMETKAGYASPLNSSQLFQLSPNASVSTVSWSQVIYESFAPSYLSEVIFALSNSDRSQTWQFNVSNVNAPGVYSGSGGIPNMVVSTGGPFHLNADGILRFEVYESFTDLAVSPNARFSAGLLTVGPLSNAVPEPSAAGLASLCVGLLAWRRKRTVQLGA